MLSKPTLKGAIVEMIVVVGSILIAFGLDAWWDGRKESEEEGQILTALAVEFDAVKKAFADGTEFHNDVSAAIWKLMELASSETPEVHPDTLDRLLADLCWSGGEDHYQSETTASVLSTGRLTLIRNQELRDMLAGWPRVIEDILEDERHEREVMHTRWWPFMQEHGYLPQLQEFFKDGPGEFSSDVRVPVRAQPTDHRALLGDSAFPNVLLFRYWSQLDILSDYQEFGPDLDLIISLIEGELR